MFIYTYPFSNQAYDEQIALVFIEIPIVKIVSKM